MEQLLYDKRVWAEKKEEISYRKIYGMIKSGDMKMRLVWSFFVAFLPSPLKIFIHRLAGAKIGHGCYIGFSVIDCKKIEIGDFVRISGFNIIHRLCSMNLGDGSRINSFNWITGAREGSLYVGKNSAITRLHFFEASGNIRIGSNSIIAGRGSHFFTHGISANVLDDVREIEIGSWCYIGSSSRFVPGSSVGNGTFVGMGSVVTKHFQDQFVLIAGNPAAVKKQLSPNDAYFARAFLPHDHHPSYYGGDKGDP